MLVFNTLKTAFKIAKSIRKPISKLILRKATVTSKIFVVLKMATSSNAEAPNKITASKKVTKMITIKTFKIILPYAANGGIKYKNIAKGKNTTPTETKTYLNARKIAAKLKTVM